MSATSSAPSKSSSYPSDLTAPSRPAWARIALFCVVAAVGLAADLGTKAWTFSRRDLFQGQPYWLWDGHVGIQLSLNEGALFGMGQGKVWLFALCSVAAAIAIPIWLFHYQAARDRKLTVVLGCVMAGVLGNLYDRLGMHGLTWGEFGAPRPDGPVYAVRDWILFAWHWDPNWKNSVVWPNFNIADSLLVCSVPFLFWFSLQSERDDATAAGD